MARFDIGKEKMVRPLAASAAAEAWVQRYYGGAFVGDTLVHAGFAVLAVDALGWGERRRPGFARDDQQALASHLMQLGLHWAGIIASDDLRAHRWLRERPEVDARRVAVLGFSMGALRAWQLAAVCDDVQACVAAHWMCTRDGLLRPGEHTLAGQSTFSMGHPGLAAELDHPDVAALVAPRPAAAVRVTAGPAVPVGRGAGRLAAAGARLGGGWSSRNNHDRRGSSLRPGAAAGRHGMAAVARGCVTAGVRRRGARRARPA